jgi:hypothetical protein
MSVDVSAYSVNRFQDAAWLVYVNGIEVPAMSVEVSFGVWQIPTAAVRLVPLPMLQRLGAEDRLHVVIFYKDTHMQGALEQFRLLGEFEVVGWTYTNSPQGRAFQLDCVNPIQIFQQMFCYYMSSLNDIVQLTDPATNNPATMIAQGKVAYPASLFLEGLVRKATVTDDKGAAIVGESDFIRRPIDFALNMLRAILREGSAETNDAARTDGKLPPSAVTAPSKNFFARWMKRTKFHSKWFALPMFEDDTPVPAQAPRSEGELSAEDEAAGAEGTCFPLVKAVQDTSVLESLQKQVGSGVGNAGSVWDLLKMVYAQMYTELAMIPCPPVGSVQKVTGKLVSASSGAEGGTSGSFWGVRTYFAKPQCVFGVPPLCNVIFPSMLQNLTFQETYITQPTRVYIGESFLSSILQSPGSQTDAIVNQLLTTGFPAEVKNRLMQTITGKGIDINSKNFLVQPEELYKGPVTRQMNAPQWMWMLQNARKGASSAGTEFAKGDSSLGKLFDTYAAYEYYRSRYAERQGGVAMVFNPYIVPGFPSFVYDQYASGFDMIGYVMSVTHSMSADRAGPHMSTQVNFSFLRSFNEVMQGRSLDSSATTLNGTSSIAYPAEVIPEVRDIFQMEESANLFYRLLFFGPDYVGSQKFVWSQSIEKAREKNPITDVFEGAVPADEWKAAFDGRDAALSAIARPVCTLQQYVESHHQRKLASLIEDGTVQVECRDFHTAVGDTSPDASGASVFWARIYKNRPAAEGAGVPDDLTNASESAEGTADSWRVAAVGEIPDTRKDWDKILLEYRKIIRAEEGKVAPQQ